MLNIVFTSRHYYWCLRPYAYLFNTYWRDTQDVLVAGYEPLPFDLPPNFSFHSIAPQTYPASQWTNGIIETLSSIDDSHFIFSLEDYWLTRHVDWRGIADLHTYAQLHPDVFRIDLTGDRLYSGHAIDIGTWSHFDLIETPQPAANYCLSTQMAIINRELFLAILKPNLSPWEYELQDQAHLLPSHYRILGTRQMPVRYTIGWGTNHDGANTSGIHKRHLSLFNKLNWLTGDPL